ncbi:SDR family oxidoreductase [Salibacteraceae bacterium]|nr:SDR family oxidoreductase [Salibacteraceae bacterium]
MGVLLIIGGSKGIGSALLALEVENRAVINISRTAPKIEHPNLTHYSLDVLNDELPTIEALDGIVYCPGSINLKPIGSLKMDDFKTDFEINVLGAVRVIQHYFRKLKKGNDSSIVLFSTVAVKRGMAFHASVAAAKAGVEGITKSLAAEFAPTIRVNCIAPSITDTPLAANLLKNDERKEALGNNHPLKRVGEAHEVAAVASFLLSEKAKSITGQIWGVDGGMGNL